MKEDKRRSTDIKVGLFVTLGVMTLVFVVFLIGSERHFFERPVFLKAFFQNVAGLKVGAPVRLAGVDVGIVSAIDFPTLVEGAEDLVTGPVDVGASRFRGEAQELDLEGVPGKTEGWRLEVRGEGLAFPTPLKPTLNLDAKAPQGQGEGRLTAQVLIVGHDQWGQPISEHIKASVIAGDAARVVGTVAFTTITDVVVRYLDEADDGEVLRIGVDPIREIAVTMRVNADALDRIRKGSLAKVDSMGLLGDKTIDISMGPAQAPRHEDGHTLRSEPPSDLLAEAKAGIDEIKGTFAGLRKAVDGFMEAGGEEKIGELVDIVNALGDEVQNGEGLIHQLIYSDASATEYQVKEVVAQLNQATQKLNRTLTDVDKMVGQVKTGDGLVHELVYGEGGEETLASAQATLEEARQLLSDVRTNEGVVHQLIYKEDGGETIGNVTAATEDLKTASADIKDVSADVKEIVAEVKRGEGTVGALIKDPTVYEDLKVLLGNVKRNDAVKALVRYAIEREDQIATPKEKE